MSNKVFTFGDIRIREVKGKYYVYLIEKDNEGNLRDYYVGPLDKIIETILRLGARGNPFVPTLSFILCSFMIECRDLALNHLLGGSWDSNDTVITSP